MFRSKQRKGRIGRLAAAVALLAVLVGIGQAFTATNTVTVTRRLGDGPGVISGFAISNVRYTSNPTNRLFVQTAQFDLDRPANRVVMKMVSSVTTAVNCTLSSGNTHATCTWPLSIAPTLLAMNQLRVSAVF